MSIFDMQTIVGYLGATCTTAAFLPQVWHSYRTRDLSGISLPMYCIFTTGVALWLLYGLMTIDWPIIIANAITFCLALCIVVLKVLSLQSSVD
jgi:MtN3 and saliva related transmembrane protein